MPYVADVVAHVLFFKDHMLTVHAHNGKYHVHAEVAEAAKKNLTEKGTNTTRKDTPGSDHIFTTTYTLPTPIIYTKWLAALPSSTTNIFLPHHFPPPRI